MNAPIVSTDDSNTNEIPSLLVPMVNHKLVLPTVSVAEMTPYKAPEVHQPVAGLMPDWYLGSFSWRGISVPMMSYEALNGYAVGPVQPESQVIVLNNTGVNPIKLPFISIPTQGIPRLSRVAVNEISQNAQATTHEYDQMQVFVAGEEAVIPDVAKLEQACIDLLGYY